MPESHSQPIIAPGVAIWHDVGAEVALLINDVDGHFFKLTGAYLLIILLHSLNSIVFRFRFFIFNNVFLCDIEQIIADLFAWENRGLADWILDAKNNGFPIGCIVMFLLARDSNQSSRVRDWQMIGFNFLFKIW